MGTDRYRELPRSVQPRVEIQQVGQLRVPLELYEPQAERTLGNQSLEFLLVTSMLATGFELDQVNGSAKDRAVGSGRYLRDFFAAMAVAEWAEKALDLVLVDEFHVSLFQAKHHFRNELAHEAPRAGGSWPREFDPTIVFECQGIFCTQHRTLATSLLERLGQWRSDRDATQGLRDLEDETRRMAAVSAARCSTGLRSYPFVEAAPPTACSPCGVVGLRVPIVPRAPGLRPELCPAHGTCVADGARPEYALAA